MKIKCIVLLTAVILLSVPGRGAEHHSSRSILVVEYSPTGIDSFFKTDNVPTKTKQLKVAGLDYYCLAAFPYSGASTVDVYCYVHDGDVWRLHMLYFALLPKYRKIDFVAGRDTITVKDATTKLITMHVKKS